MGGWMVPFAPNALTRVWQVRRADNHLTRAIRDGEPLIDFSNSGADLLKASSELLQMHISAANAVLPTTRTLLRHARTFMDYASQWSTSGFMEEYRRVVATALTLPAMDPLINDIVRQMTHNNPIVRWFAEPESRRLVDTPIYKHVRNLTMRTQMPWLQSNPLRGVELAKREIIDRYTARNVTSARAKRVEMNWIRLQRVYWGICHAFWPHAITRQVHERFILDAGCPMIYGIVNLTASTVGYCKSVQTRNAGRMSRSIVSRFPEAAVHWADGVTQYHGSMNETHAHSGVWQWGTRSASARASGSSASVPRGTEAEEHAWEHPVSTRAPKQRPAHRNLFAMDPQQWRIRHAMAKRTGDPSQGTNFWFIDSVLNWIDSLFGWDLQQTIAQGSLDFTAWINNNNTDISSWPDVGASYWVRFPFLCEFPSVAQPLSNLNCVIGIGLDEAVSQIFWWSIILFVLLSLLLPAMLMPLVGFSAFIFYIVVVPAMAWHYSPRCWLMTPSALGGGVSIPIWPFPIAPPALPMCMFDEIVTFLNKWITDCYAFIIPACMVPADVCPECPNKIVWPSCQDIGMGDGITNFIYLGYKLFGATFTMYLTGFFQTCFGAWSANIVPYIFQTVNNFELASDTQQCRLDWCFYATLPSILVFVIPIVYIATAIGFILPSFVSWILALLQLLLASPFGLLVPNVQSNYNYVFSQSQGPPDDSPSSAPADEGDEPPPPPPPDSIEARIEAALERRKQHKKKRKVKPAVPVAPLSHFLGQVSHDMLSALFLPQRKQ
jgi:hypothetical protein